MLVPIGNPPENAPVPMGPDGNAPEGEGRSEDACRRTLTMSDGVPDGVPVIDRRAEPVCFLPVPVAAPEALAKPPLGAGKPPLPTACLLPVPAAIPDANPPAKPLPKPALGAANPPDPEGWKAPVPVGCCCPAEPGPAETAEDNCAEALLAKVATKRILKDFMLKC